MSGHPGPMLSYLRRRNEKYAQTIDTGECTILIPSLLCYNVSKRTMLVKSLYINIHSINCLLANSLLQSSDHNIEYLGE